MRKCQPGALLSLKRHAPAYDLSIEGGRYIATGVLNGVRPGQAEQQITIGEEGRNIVYGPHHLTIGQKLGFGLVIVFYLYAILDAVSIL